MAAEPAPTATPRISVDEVNAMDEVTFVGSFGGIFESSPHLATTAWAARPFADDAALISAFDAAATALGPDQVLDLLRAHPMLGARGPMAAASRGEQAGAGLDRLAGDAQDRMTRDNMHYAERFGFPFIIAVRGSSPDDVADALTRRLGNDRDDEIDTAFEQVRRIARLRIEQRLRPPGDG